MQQKRQRSILGTMSTVSRSEDIGRTNLITMEIDTSDSLPSAKKPYTLPLIHYEWVQQEIESLGRADIITRSVSPWASPVVVVPEKSAPGESPRRRMCIDFHAINALQPTGHQSRQQG